MSLIAQAEADDSKVNSLEQAAADKALSRQKQKKALCCDLGIQVEADYDIEEVVITT